MILYINTADKEKVILVLRKSGVGKSTLGAALDQQEFLASRSQAEKLLPAINSLLKKNKFKLSALKGIVVADEGGSFTSLRIGIATANALAFALGIPIFPENKRSRLKTSHGLKIVAPKYDRPPAIGSSAR